MYTLKIIGKIGKTLRIISKINPFDFPRKIIFSPEFRFQKIKIIFRENLFNIKIKILKNVFTIFFFGDDKIIDILTSLFRSQLCFTGPFLLCTKARARTFSSVRSRSQTPKRRRRANSSSRWRSTQQRRAPALSANAAVASSVRRNWRCLAATLESAVTAQRRAFRR